MNEKVKKVLDTLPTSSGCYIMKNADGIVIYVGKAKNLRNRVHQYFQNTDRGIKTSILVEHIDDIEYIITTDEVNALVLENMLIKKYKPHFNILLKDDKSYPYIKLSTTENFPHLEVVRKFSIGEKAKYFGPYMLGISAADVVSTINSIFCLRSCKTNLDKVKKNQRACLDYHLGRCSAPCVGYISKEDYKKRIDEAVDFLNGNTKKACDLLKIKMFEASEREDFENAMIYKNKLLMLEKLERKQVVAVPRDLSCDVFAVAEKQGMACVSLMIIRNGKVQGVKNTNIDFTEDVYNGLTDYIIAYYDKNQISAKEILTNIALPDADSLSSYIKEMYGIQVDVLCPVKGKKKVLVGMALDNAENSLNNFIGSEEKKKAKAEESLLQLTHDLNLSSIPYRIECYDNSHISGTNYASSMVVFLNGQAEKSHYRRFKVKTVEGNNDYEVMKEILYRRLLRLKNADSDVSFGSTPDLIILDGGKGQLTYGLQAMNSLNMDIPMVSLAEREELLYKPNDNNPVVVFKNTPAYFLIERIRDEAHRFAITFHRSLREKKQIESELNKIEGLGKKRIELLFNHFNTIEDLKKASIDELKAVKGLPETIANNIYSFYHGD